MYLETTNLNGKRYAYIDIVEQIKVYYNKDSEFGKFGKDEISNIIFQTEKGIFELTELEPTTPEIEPEDCTPCFVLP